MGLVEHWRVRQERYRLVGECCPNCDSKIFPPRDVCPDCSVEVKEPFTFSGKGEIHSFTKVHEGPKGFEGQAPYYVALVKLEEGPMLTAQLTDIGKDEPEIGMKVEMVTRKIKEEGERGLIIYGYKFRPPLNNQQEEGQASY